MDELAAPPTGTKGTVIRINGIGDILVNRDNGSTLNVDSDVDYIRKVITPISKEDT